MSVTRGTSIASQRLHLIAKRVTLAPGQVYVLSFVSKHTSAVDCNVILQNDMVKEEEEYFTVTLQTNDLGARLVTSYCFHHRHWGW